MLVIQRELSMRKQFIHAAATALVAGLLLAACSGDSDSESGDAIEDVDTEDQGQARDDGGATESPEATPSDDGIDRPEIVLPDDMNNVFEDIETGDETKDSIITDVVERINAIDMAIAESNPDLEALEFYSARDGLDSATSYVRSAAESGEAGRTWTGTVDYYDFVVNNEDRRSREPIVTYCADRSDSHTVELATGEILSGDDGEQHVGGQDQIQVVVEQNEVGVWQVTRVLPDDDEGDQECVR
jgi:hypothetical protein